LKCNKKGHTTKYCRVKETPKKVKIEKEYDEDGFMIIKSRNQKTNKEEREYMENKNNFAILCEDIDSKEPEKTEQKLNPFAKRPAGISWADWEDMDN
jgi:hypothetical protein